jgi:hypothetical protein
LSQNYRAYNHSLCVQASVFRDCEHLLNIEADTPFIFVAFALVN